MKEIIGESREEIVKAEEKRSFYANVLSALKTGKEGEFDLLTIKSIIDFDVSRHYMEYFGLPEITDGEEEVEEYEKPSPEDREYYFDFVKRPFLIEAATKVVETEVRAEFWNGSYSDRVDILRGVDETERANKIKTYTTIAVAKHSPRYTNAVYEYECLECGRTFYTVFGRLACDCCDDASMVRLIKVIRE